MSRWLPAFVLAFVVGFVSGNPQGQAKDTNLGKWRLNVEKSKFSPGPPPPKDQTRTYEDRGDGMLSFYVETVNQQGNTARQMVVFKYDGKEYPLAQLNATNLMTVANRRIDAYTVELTFRANGKVTTTAIEKISKDGKTLTFEQKGTTGQGQAVNNYIVLDRQ